MITYIACKLEVIAIKMYTVCGKAFTICCAYRPLSSTAEWPSAFHAYLGQLSIVTPYCIIARDFNCDLLKSSSYSDKLANSFDFKQHFTTPTRITASQRHFSTIFIPTIFR